MECGIKADFMAFLGDLMLLRESVLNRCVYYGDAETRRRRNAKRFRFYPYFYHGWTRVTTLKLNKGFSYLCKSDFLDSGTAIFARALSNYMRLARDTT